jgi:hypothetical protein
MEAMTLDAENPVFGPVPPPRAVHSSPDEPDADGNPDFAFVQDLLRRPAAFLDRLQDDDAAQLARSLVLTVLVAGAAFGAVVGAYRGGVQIVYCALKIPLVLLSTLVISSPAVIAIARATGSTLRGRDVIALTLGASARFALVLAGLAPVVWLANGILGYHDAVLGVFGACFVAGIAAAALLFRGLRRGGRFGAFAGLAFIAVYAAVGGQTSWMLRPYIVRPQTQRVPFMRAVEGDLADSVRMTARSAVGIYDVRQQGNARSNEAPVSSEANDCGGARCE